MTDVVPESDRQAAIATAQVRMMEAMALLEMAGAGADVAACHLQAAIDALEGMGTDLPILPGSDMDASTSTADFLPRPL